MSRADGGKRKRLTGVLRMERVPLVNCIELQMRWVIVAGESVPHLRSNQVPQSVRHRASEGALQVVVSHRVSRYLVSRDNRQPKVSMIFYKKFHQLNLKQIIDDRFSSLAATLQGRIVGLIVAETKELGQVGGRLD